MRGLDEKGARAPIREGSNIKALREDNGMKARTCVMNDSFGGGEGVATGVIKAKGKMAACPVCITFYHVLSNKTVS